ncbi:MAG: DNA recombination protein RmuC [Pseudomonadota bacterium]|nr:DNA recombination protein RmuC [Pseudomonadota bacterium]
MDNFLLSFLPILAFGVLNYFLFCNVIKKVSELEAKHDLKNTKIETVYSHVNELLERHHQTQITQNAKNNEQFHTTINTLQKTIKIGMDEIRQQLQVTLQQNSNFIEKQLQGLTKTTEQRLVAISGQVDKRLNEGFEQTTQIFQNVIKRLTIIDEAQKEIIKLSGDVVSLQDILNDKRSRGAFGEVQLISLIKNLIPENNFKLQATLSNGKRVDCLLLLPAPTGSIAIDAKFPLENYKAMLNQGHNDNNMRSQFKLSVKKHIDDIASKYIIPGETADGSILFLPAEAVFAEIHANFYDLVEYAYKNKVWLASPTTMMAILTTSLAAIKDVETKKQIHIIQKHLGLLSIDFSRFQKRMDNLARHIRQAEEDVTQIHQSSKKITARFNQIEQVELEKQDELLT